MSKAEKNINQDQEKDKKINNVKKSSYSKKKKVKKNILMQILKSKVILEEITL